MYISRICTWRTTKCFFQNDPKPNLRACHKAFSVQQAEVANISNFQILHQNDNTKKIKTFFTTAA